MQVVVAVFFPSREYSRRSKSDGSTLPFLYKLSWGLEVKVKALFQHLSSPQNMASTVSLVVTVSYWALVHPVVVESDWLKVWLFSNRTDEGAL